MPLPIHLRAKGAIIAHKKRRRNGEPLLNSESLVIQGIIRELKANKTLSEKERIKLLKELDKIRRTHTDAALTYLEEVEKRK